MRTHLYTQGEHWREGVLLTYQDHFARVELNENRKEIRLLVWGTQPHNFFTILMNTIDVILDFFSGLTIWRGSPLHLPLATPVQRTLPALFQLRRVEAPHGSETP